MNNKQKNKWFLWLGGEITVFTIIKVVFLFLMAHYFFSNPIEKQLTSKMIYQHVYTENTED
ncbi:MAG: hypothetical protein AB7F64_08005 [Gammaproteobacteria bacterium]